MPGKATVFVQTHQKLFLAHITTATKKHQYPLCIVKFGSPSKKNEPFTEQIWRMFAGFAIVMFCSPPSRHVTTCRRSLAQRLGKSRSRPRSPARQPQCPARRARRSWHDKARSGEKIWRSPEVPVWFHRIWCWHASNWGDHIENWESRTWSIIQGELQHTNYTVCEEKHGQKSQVTRVLNQEKKSNEPT